MGADGAVVGVKERPEHEAASEKDLFKDLRQEIADARALLEFAISHPPVAGDERRIDDRLIEQINQAEDLLRGKSVPSAADRAVFEKAYRDLAGFTSPVTARTLRATSDSYGRHSYLSPRRARTAEATIWSRKLTIWTLLFLAIAVVGDLIAVAWGNSQAPIDAARGPAISWRHYLLTLSGILLPFTYGGIGSCVYLLRSCHQYIYTRQFDPRRIPEYYNRMLLGIVSGGAVTLFVSQIPDGQGAALKLSAAALGFLAGYNTDFLFSAVERVTAAILPKVSAESVRTAAAKRGTAVSVALEDVSLRDLLDRHTQAKTPEERKLLEGLIDKVKDRL